MIGTYDFHVIDYAGLWVIVENYLSFRPFMNIVSTLGDVLSALFFGIYGMIVGPLGVFRGPLTLSRSFSHTWVLAKRGLLSRFVRVMIDWRLGHFDITIAETEAIIETMEKDVRECLSSASYRNTLVDLYTLLVRAYLHTGRMDDAMLCVIRAKKNANIDRLPGLAELNTKTASLVRAGLSAGKLLDGGGLATLFVKTTPEEKERHLRSVDSDKPKRQGASRHPDMGEGEDKPDEEKDSLAKVIPFPTTTEDQDL